MSVAVSRDPSYWSAPATWAGAMLAGWLKSGIPGASILVLDPGPSPAMLKLIADNGVRHETAAPAGVKAGVLFVAVKPQMMDAVLPPVKGLVGSGDGRRLGRGRQDACQSRSASAAGVDGARHAEHAGDGRPRRHRRLCQCAASAPPSATRCMRF